MAEPRAAGVIAAGLYLRGELPQGQFAHVKVIGHTDYDLIAEPVEGEEGRTQSRMEDRDGKRGIGGRNLEP